ncbi:hypothetical protein DM02DRAFT_619488 [Periconia macrospinosa]|uniref:Uncharacterized protein n=1 Tax=Periconia macrospinosa TaxID=97972 RepID=A0A2V1D531_9PLEO|nr:hypothetical protein DM02DRAFT_619488 [Periconia macrospinosa]
MRGFERREPTLDERLDCNHPSTPLATYPQRFYTPAPSLPAVPRSIYTKIWCLLSIRSYVLTSSWVTHSHLPWALPSGSLVHANPGYEIFALRRALSTVAPRCAYGIHYTPQLQPPPSTQQAIVPRNYDPRYVTDREPCQRGNRPTRMYHNQSTN